MISIVINSLKIVLIFHPLPTPPLKGEEPAIIPSPLEGEGKGEGDHLCLYYYETVNIAVRRYRKIHPVSLETFFPHTHPVDAEG
jgi:hypothetical protein